MSSTTIVALASACALTLATADHAAGQWSVEGRIGAAVPTGELAEEPVPNQSTGFSFAADAMYTFRQNVSLYAGASRETFSCDGCTEDVTSAGLDGGLKYLFSVDGPAIPWVRGGLLLHRASVDGVDSDWGLGVDSGVGLDWVVNPRVAIVPAVRLKSYNSGELSLTFVTVDLGVHLHFND
jgi:hypothetical protein